MRLSDAVPKGKLASSPYPSPRASELHKILQAGLFIARVGEMLLKQGSGEKDLIRAQPGEYFRCSSQTRRIRSDCCGGGLRPAPELVRRMMVWVTKRLPDIVTSISWKRALLSNMSMRLRRAIAFVEDEELLPPQIFQRFPVHLEAGQAQGRRLQDQPQLIGFAIRRGRVDQRLETPAMPTPLFNPSFSGDAVEDARKAMAGELVAPRQFHL